jgi:hypothetical protein
VKTVFPAAASAAQTGAPATAKIKAKAEIRNVNLFVNQLLLPVFLLDYKWVLFVCLRQYQSWKSVLRLIHCHRRFPHAPAKCDDCENFTASRQQMHELSARSNGGRRTVKISIQNGGS